MKNQYIGGNCLKSGGGGGLKKKNGGAVFKEGGWYPNAHYDIN